MTVTSCLPAARVVVILIASLGMVTVTTARSAVAQSNPTPTNIIPPSESVTLQAKITAMDTGTRTVTLKGGAGRTVSVVAGPAVRLEMLKVGDIVNANTIARSVSWLCPRNMVTAPA